jgi:hypothetical protein
VSDPAGVPPGRGLTWNPPLSWLPRPVLEPASLARSVAVGWLLAFPASIIFALVLHWVAPQAKAPEFQISGAAAIGMLVLFSPIVETLIMGGVLLLLLRVLPPTWAVVLSALAWGAAHSFAVPIWGLIIWWPFLIFSALFVTWRSRSLALAFLVPMITHGLQNLLPAILVAVGRAV